MADLIGHDLPGYEIVRTGLADLRLGHETEASLLVSMAAPRLQALGIEVPSSKNIESAHRLYEHLSEIHHDDAHGRYNALVRRIVSFARAAEHASTS